MRLSCISLIALLSIAMIAEDAFAQPANSTKADFTFQTQGLPEPSQSLCRELFAASSAPFAKHDVKLLRSEYTVEGQWNEGDEIVEGDDAFKASAFPFVVDILSQKEVPVEVTVLPEPRWVRRHCMPPTDFRELAAKMTEREKLLEFNEARLLEKLQNGSHDDGDLRLDCIEFFRLQRNTDRWNDFQPLPRGFDGWKWQQFDNRKAHYPVGLMEKLGRLHVRIHPSEFAAYPQTEHYLDFRTNQSEAFGMITSEPALKSNLCVRWITKNDPKACEFSNWLAYGIVDANGAYSINFPPDERTNHHGTFYRLLIAPWTPTFKEFDNEIGDQPIDGSTWLHPNLLLAPAVWEDEFYVRKSDDRTFEENWTLCEQFYSEHEVPVWCLCAHKDSQPFRELFFIKHFDEPCEHNLQKILIFSSVNPQDLIRVLARVHGMEDTAEEIYAEHEDELQAAYDAFRAEINKSLR